MFSNKAATLQSIKGSINMNVFSKRLVLMLGASAVFASTSNATDMTVVSWGGAYQISQQKAYTEPYSAANGVNFVWDESSGEAVNKLRLQADSGDISWDVVDVVAADAMRLCDEGLARVIDHDTELAAAPDGTPATQDFGSLVVSECFVPQIVYSTTWGVRNNVDEWNGAMPTSVCDVFDTEKFPGKRAILSSAVNNMEWGAYCSRNWNQNPASMYDLLATENGQQAALDMWSSIKDDLIFAASAADVPQLLADGEVVMGSTYNGRLFSLIAETGNTTVEMLWDAQVFDLDGWIIPANLPADREAEAMKFLKFATDTQRLADQSKYISYGPARLSSAPLVGKHAELGIDMAPHMPTDPKNAANMILTDYEFWADYRDDIDAKWEAWKAG
jgi:putative spermidine/putrescine transport system substrate-binding protein